MEETITGYCPTQGKEYTISVTYQNASTPSQTVYVLTLADCEYNKFGDKCSCDCPIIKMAPKEIRL